MSDRVFVDTNVWVYAVDGADPAKQAEARRVTASAPGRDIVISSQVLSEIYTVITRRLVHPVPEETAAAMVRHLSDLPVVPIDAALVVAAVEGSREWRISLWDALILRAAEVANCDIVLSEDLGAGRAYGSVTVSNPFA